MASTPLSLLSLLLLLSFSLICAKPPTLHLHLTTDPTTTTTTDTLPTTFFEVTKPIKLPNTKPCSTHILQHDFAYTYGSPPVSTPYSPPSTSNCPSNTFSRIVLQWSATCKGRQFDRIFGVWLGGVELLRSCTAEPRATGIQWTVKKDITRNMPMNDGLWFEIENSTDVEVKEFRVPQNVYRAVLEVYVSFHENDEFWPTNVVNEYVLDNNLTGYPGNGPFREVVVSLDGGVIGAVWPFTVVYTGGVNPLLWRPITGIGSFDLPTYDIEITPFLGSILNGKTHEFGFSVTNALNVWYIDANLHVWLDEKSEKTTGKLLTQNISPLHVSLVSNYTGLNGTFVTKATRSIKSTGWVQSSHGKIVTETTQKFNYTNIMVMAENADSQIVNQIIEFNDSVYAKIPSSVVSKESLKTFSFYIHSDTEDKGNGSYAELADITLGFNEKKIGNSGSKSFTSVLENVQNGQGSMFVKGNLVVSGLGSTQQMYKYGDDEFCYFRDVSSSNYTIIYDKEGHTCSKSEKSGFSFVIGKHWPFPARDRHAI
ncbi:putative peptide-N(4)-(N-acetyl-beta-glucosaminyl)asparagine amidase [Helianthus annuus]|nr:putative peptide-N(4)-(N-acetyl-beta-glucosaminyl)asparagine amidase [Helianthus annuus]